MIMKTTEDVVRNAQSTRGGFVLVSLYSWMTVTYGVAIARFVRGLLLHKIDFGTDDSTSLAASFTYMGAVVSWQYAINGGLGKSSSDVSTDDGVLFSKAVFAAQLFEIVTMAFAKLSSTFLIDRVSPQSRKSRMALFGMVGAWSVFSITAIAIRWGPSTGRRLWSSEYGKGGLLITTIVLNAATDLLLSAWLFPTLASLSLSTEKRFMVMVLFGSRAIVSIIAGVQIWAALEAISGNDPTRDTVDFAVMSQAVTSLSIITANIPRIKRILDVGGNGILYPQIQASELSVIHSKVSRQTSGGDHGLKLIPSGSGKFTVTVSSKGSKAKGKAKKGKAPSDWQGLVSLGSKEDEHTSTSSLFDENDRKGVMLEREFEVVVEESNARSTSMGCKDDITPIGSAL